MGKNLKGKLYRGPASISSRASQKKWDAEQARTRADAERQIEQAKRKKAAKSPWAGRTAPVTYSYETDSSTCHEATIERLDHLHDCLCEYAKIIPRYHDTVREFMLQLFESYDLTHSAFGVWQEGRKDRAWFLAAWRDQRSPGEYWLRLVIDRLKYIPLSVVMSFLRGMSNDQLLLWDNWEPQSHVFVVEQVPSSADPLVLRAAKIPRVLNVSIHPVVIDELLNRRCC